MSRLGPASARAASPSPGPSYEWEALVSRDDKGEIRPTYGNLCLMLRAIYPGRFSYDTMRETACVDGAPVTDTNLGRIREDLERKHAAAFAHDNIAKAVSQVAEEKRVHPVQAFLEGLTWDGTPRLSRVASEILGIAPDPLTVSMLTRWFVSSVARAFDPGCKVDTCLILQGPQGSKKSTFFRILGGAWFADTQIDISTRQAFLQLAAAWIYEWSELENVTSKKAISEVKAFITSREDTFVPPYGRSALVHKRSTVIVGTTNERGFLADPTGSRRWWILELHGRINLALCEEWREQLWAEAVHHYLDGFEWWLEDSQEVERERAAERWSAEDAWDQPVQRFLREWMAKPRDHRLNVGDGLTSYVLMTQALKLEGKQIDHGAQNRLAKIMRRLGYETARIWCGQGDEAVRLRVWSREARADEPDEQAEAAVARAPP